jgi:hypothetical protein
MKWQKYAILSEESFVSVETPYMALIVPNSFYDIDAGLHALSFSPGFNVHKLFKIIYNYLQKHKSFTDEFHYLK